MKVTSQVLSIFLLLFLSHTVFSQDSIYIADNYQNFLSNDELGFASLSEEHDASENLSASLAMSQTVCEDAADILWLSGYEGKIIHWELSEDNSATWKIIHSQSSFYYYEDLQKSTTYRVLIQLDGQSYYSNSAKISIDSMTSPGNLVRTETDGIRIQNFEGEIVSWQIYEADGWVSMANSCSVLALENPDTNREYRVLVRNGMCPTETTPVFHYD